MKKAGIPYEIQENKLYLPTVVWPQNCVCCGKETGGTTWTLEHKARIVSTAEGSTTLSSYYPLAWQVPCCERCKLHFEQGKNIMVAPVMLVIFLPIVLTLISGKAASTLFFLLMLAISVLLAVVLFQVLKAKVKSKMTDTCSHYASAVFASDDTSKVFFHFYNDAIAQQFAALNQVELLAAEKPNFWQLKKH